MREKLKYLHMKAKFISSSNFSYGEREKEKKRASQVEMILDRTSSPCVKGNNSYLIFKSSTYSEKL